MEIVKGEIANAITSVAINHIVATADDLYDIELDGYQSDINKCFCRGIEELKEQLSASTITITQKLAGVAQEASVQEALREVGKIADEIEDEEHGLKAIRDAINEIEKTAPIPEKDIKDIFE